MILQADSFQWIHEQRDDSLPSMFIGFPDYYEVKDSLEDLEHYKRWILGVACIDPSRAEANA